MKIQKVLVSRIVSVFDGDTFRVDVDTWPKLFGYHIPVRIRGINCDEKRAFDKNPDSKAFLAAEYTKTALTNAKRVELLNVGRDKYFRLLADVLIDGHDHAAALLAAGLARRYKIE